MAYHVLQSCEPGGSVRKIDSDQKADEGHLPYRRLRSRAIFWDPQLIQDISMSSIRHHRPLSILAALAVLSPPAICAAQDRDQVAKAQGGMVVTAHPLATYAGQRILDAGGNAADAAVAAAFAVAVVRPSMNSIGGRNQILVRLPNGQVHGIDGTTQVPEGYDTTTAPRAAYGYATIGVPGALAGLMRLHDEHGSLPLDVVMAPALDYAENGFRLLSGQARFHQGAVKPIAESEGASAVYLKDDGTPYGVGELLRQTELASTYHKIIEGGADAFYRGEIAAAMADDIQSHGGFVTKQSLANYKAFDARIVRGSYRGYDLVAMDLPASGAIAIQALHIMENFDRDEFSAAEWATITAQAIALAIPELMRAGTDTGAIRATSKEWAAQQADRVMMTAAATGGGFDTPSPWNHEGYTTHISVADRGGMVVSLTQTIGPAMGSKVATPGLGFLYAVTLGGYLGGDQSPGARARSGITPLLVLKDGEPVLVLGAAGGLRIISAVVQVATRFIDDDMTLAEASAAPRINPDFGRDFTFSGLAMETTPDRGWTPDQVEAVRAMGFEVTETPRPGAFGRVQAIRYDREAGTWVGVSDPGSEGSAGGAGN